MANPKIVYTRAGGSELTLTFAFPPQQQPGYFKSAVRHDNVSTAGIRESVIERTDEFLELSLPWIRAGSDLASLRTQCVDKGDHFLVNGQKIWTSGAQYADMCFALVRTDNTKKHEGI